MSATMTAPEAVEAPLKSAPQPLRPVAEPVRPPVGPEVSPASGPHAKKSVERARNGLFFAAWAPGMVVTGVLGAIALAVAQPILMARTEYEQRRYR